MKRFATQLSCWALPLTCLLVVPVHGAPSSQKESDQFLAKALDFSVSVLDLANKADGKASRAPVQKLAQRMMEEHKKLNKELISLASESKLGVATGVSNEHREAMVRLTILKGEDFDRAFLRYVVRRHEDAIKLFESDGAKQTNEALRAFADRTLPALRKHLEEAKSLGGASDNP